MPENKSLVSVKFSKGTYDRIVALANEEGVSVEEYVSKLLERIADRL